MRRIALTLMVCLLSGCAGQRAKLDLRGNLEDRVAVQVVIETVNRKEP